ncbi:MAG: YbaK/EbsC family protein [Odoribacter splanchnicus]
MQTFLQNESQNVKSWKEAESTGHAIGGVCPFANPEGVQTYLDISLQRFDTVFPACGSSNSAIELHCDELFRYALAIQWIDVCK